MARYSHTREKVEKIIGRKLKEDEVIHHKDHNPDNNDISNLTVIYKTEHFIYHFKGKNALYKYRKKQNTP